MKKWTIEDSKELYNINGWGTSYFGVNESGNIFVNPSKNNVKIDIREVIDELALRDVTPPVLLRFPDILDNHASRKQLRNTITRAKVLSSIPSR